MPIIGDLFNLLLLQPTINLIIFIVRLLESLHIPGALGFAIILLTVIIRLIIWPFMSSQLKSTKKMAELKPHLDILKEKHKDSKQNLASAQMALYKEHGVNPAGGCLPALIQILLILPLYQVIQAFLSGHDGLTRINYFLYDKSWHLDKLPDPSFFGLNLAAKPADFGQVGVLVLLIPVVTALLQFILSKMMTPQPIKPYPSDSAKEKKEKESTEDTMMAMQSQMSFIMPLMIGYFAFSFPIGLALYWNTLNVMSIYQQYLISGWGDLKNFFKLIGNLGHK